MITVSLPSDVWLHLWKNRHGIRQLRICGEKLSSDTSAAEAFKSMFQDIVNSLELSNEQIYNCDETGLFFKMLPSKTLVCKNDRHAPGFKLSTDHVTVLACKWNKSDSFPRNINSRKPRALKDTGKKRRVMAKNDHSPFLVKNEYIVPFYSVIQIECKYD